MKKSLLVRWFLRLSIAVPLLFIVSATAITCSGLTDSDHQADLAVILGSTVLPNGTPSMVLQTRLDHAIDLYRQGYFKIILVSGAHRDDGYDEASAMRRYLEANGIPHDAIFEDRNGFTTWWTAKNTTQFLKNHNLTSVLVISQYYHIPRCRIAFAKFGINPVYTSHARYWRRGDFYSLFRESIAYPVYFLRDANETDPPKVSL